jgi:hypothetical protein
MPETLELKWCHGFQNIHLTHERFHDFQYPLHDMVATHNVVGLHSVHQKPSLMQQLFKPKFVGLVNYDE